MRIGAGQLGAVVAVTLALGVAGGLHWPGSPVAEAQGVALMTDEAARIALFERARDSVVAISTSSDRTNPWSGRWSPEALGAGTGFLWDSEGHMVTNDHVIGGAATAMVLLADGRSVGATLVGRDPWHDIAVLKIEGEDLPEPLPLGDSRALQVGQTVLAIGNPFGLDWTLTTGIVSALDRELPGEEGRGQGGLIQTDAAINPGNSGGPLLDSAGRVIGVNSSIYSPSGTNAGIGFAVPSGTLERVVPQLISQGFFAPPSLGIRWDWRVNAAMNRRGLPGVMVLDVAPGSDAAEVGLEPARISAAGQVLLGHVVTAIDGIPVTTVEEMLAVLDDHLPGDTVEVTFEKRNEKTVRELRLIPGDPAGIER